MSSSPTITEMHTEISTAIETKDMSGLYIALNEYFSSKKSQLTEQELADPIYSAALSYAAECKEDKNAVRVTRLLMQNIYTHNNQGSISVLLVALRTAAEKENVTFINTVLEESELELKQDLLAGADSKLRECLFNVKPELQNWSPAELGK